MLNFTNHSGKIYKAKVSNVEDVRQLYINGEKKQLAKSENKITPTGDCQNGFTFNKSQIPLLSKPQNAEIRTNHSWRSFIMPISTITENGENVYVKFQDKIFNDFFRVMAWDPVNYNHYTFFNDYNLLDKDGEFYFDKDNKMLYYYKEDGLDLNNSNVVVPNLEKIIEIKGDNLNSKVKNIEFNDVNIAHTSFNMPSYSGYSTMQSQSINSWDKSKTDAKLVNFTPSGIRLDACENINFNNCEIYGFGAGGIGLTSGVNNCNITKNILRDIGDSAITVGLPNQAVVEQDAGLTDVAYGKNATASSTYKFYDPNLAFQGDTQNGWSSMDNGEEHWLQVDLGKPYTIDKVQVLSRLGENQPSTRKNFRILASVDNSFSNPSELGRAGGTPFDFGGVWEAKVTDKNKYQFIRIQRLSGNSEYFFVAGMRVLTSDLGEIPVKEICKNNLIEDNLITRAADEFSSSPAVSVYYSDSLRVQNNEIYDIPAHGISVGWGWNFIKNSNTAKNNVISKNVIQNYNKECSDSGAIYTLGTQLNAQIQGNYIKGATYFPGGIYPDEGSMGYNFESNIIDDVSHSFFPWAMDTQNNSYKNNTTSSPLYYSVRKNEFVGNKYMPIVSKPADVGLKTRSLLDGQYIEYENTDSSFSNLAVDYSTQKTINEKINYMIYYVLKPEITRAASILSLNYDNTVNKTALNTAVNHANEVYGSTTTNLLDIINERNLLRVAIDTFLDTYGSQNLWSDFPVNITDNYNDNPNNYMKINRNLPK